jgi:hypothetical protein
MGERRKTRRISVSEPVIIVWDRGNVVGEVRDVTHQGMFVALTSTSDVTGARLVVQILPAHPREGVQLAGVVRWSNGRGMGIELTESPGARGIAVLEGLIATRQPS